MVMLWIFKGLLNNSRMNDQDPKPKNKSESGISVAELLDSGNLEGAIEAVSDVTYSSQTTSDKIGDLRQVLRVLRESEGGAKSALALVDVLIPQPEATEDEINWHKKYEASFYDYMVQDLVISALQERDFDTAVEVVGRMDDWYIGSAMDGDDLLELAYRANDPAIMAAVWTLIKRHWGNGRAREAVPELATSITDQAMIDAINGWLVDTDIEYRIPNLSA
jgi:hypothetical protein